MSGLARGDLLPRMVAPTPGRRTLRLAQKLRRYEAPGVNTLGGELPPLIWDQARGANVLDVDGNRYLDFTSGFGVAVVGHRHPAVLAAIARQSRQLLHGLGDAAAHPARIALGERLTRRAPIHAAQVYFAASGADAVEIALKTAFLATGRRGLLCFAPAYHGSTLGALAATSREAFRAPFAPLLRPQVVRLPFGCPGGEVASTLDAHPEVGALLVEPIVGREGVLVPPRGWLAALARQCRQRGVLLIADEILTGFGRTGAWFAVEPEGVEPDLLCCGKALGGGLPLAAVVGRRDLFSVWDRPGEALHTATFLAHPLACAAAVAVLDLLTRARLPRRAARLGRWLGLHLAEWPRRFPAVAAVRGRGLLWGIEFRDAGLAVRFQGAARRSGVLLLVGGAEGRVAELLPPLTITERQLAAGIERLAAAAATLATESAKLESYGSGSKKRSQRGR